MATTNSHDFEGIEPRTVRACVEPMVVVPHGDASGMFEVWTGTCDEDGDQPYVVDLAGEHDRCTCPDVQHNLETHKGERCKHACRVRLEFGLAPFEDFPQVRSEYAAPTDIEFARRRRWLAAFVHYYNRQRPNQALDNRTPAVEMIE